MDSKLNYGKFVIKVLGVDLLGFDNVFSYYQRLVLYDDNTWGFQYYKSKYNEEIKDMEIIFINKEDLPSGDVINTSLIGRL